MVNPNQNDEFNMMPFGIRFLRKSDISNMVKIEREIFPAMSSVTSFGKEIKNADRIYIVAFERKTSDGGFPHCDGPFISEKGSNFKRQIEKTVQWIQKMSNRDLQGPKGGSETIVGFLGAWYVVNQMHIVSVGVLHHYRGRGVGELLLIGAVNQAIANQISSIILEVRDSNTAARNLYSKYKFKERGVRKRYYIDDREDAKIMTADSVDTLSYLNLFEQLQKNHKDRWGIASMHVD